MQALRLEEPPVRLEGRQPLVELSLDGLGRLRGPLPGRHEVRLRVHRHAVEAAERPACQRVERHQRVDVVAEELDAQGRLLVRREHFDRVAAHAEGAAPELVVVALVLQLDELAEDLVAVQALAALERQGHPVVGLRCAEAVDARHARHDQDVAPLEQRARRREPHPVDLVVGGGLLLDVRVGGRHVGFRLVVVVVADEVLDGVLREEAAELLIELRGERLVVHHHQRRSVHARHDLGHGERLARPGDAEQHLPGVAAVEARLKLGDGARLVAAQFEVGHEGETAGG